MGRKRERRLPVCFTFEEFEQIEKLSKRFGYKNNISSYIRRRSLNKKFVIEDIKGKNEIIEEIARIGNNINQTVKSINIIALKSKAERNDILEIKNSAKNILVKQKEINKLLKNKLFVSFEQGEIKDDND